MKYFSEKKWLKNGSRKKEINEYANLLRQAKKAGSPEKLLEEHELKGAHIVAAELSHRMDNLQEAVLHLSAQSGAKPYLKAIDND